MKKLWAIPISIILIIFDYYTKYLTRLHLNNTSKPIIEDVFELTFVKNTGAAFGMLKNQRIFFIIITVVFLIISFVLLYKLNLTKRYIPFGLCIIFLLSGAIGNFIDRITLGYVTDMFYFKLINFPVFNVADCYITVSVAVLIVLILFIYKDDEPIFTSKTNKNQ